MAELFDYAVEQLRQVRALPSRNCKICNGVSHPFDVLDFSKSCDNRLYPNGMSGIPIVYRMCEVCEFIFTDAFDDFSADDWQRHIYNDEYIKVDPDYIDSRPRANATLLTTLLRGRKQTVVGLDYGGGSGRAVALLRKEGWMFDTVDPFGYTDILPGRSGHYNFCSSFEVFEHSPNPVHSLQDIVARASPERLMVLIGTQVHDGIVSEETRLSWWYAAPRNGHVSLFSRKSLRILAESCGLRYIPVRGLSGTHMLARGIGDGEARTWLLQGKARLAMRIVLQRLKISPA